MTSSTRPVDGSTDTPGVLEREHELEAIEAAIESAEGGGGRAIVITGEAGIGKSTLARHAIDVARRRGLRVLRAQGGELERGLPYGVVIELFGALSRSERLGGDVFAGPARIAAPLLGVTGGDGPGVRGDTADPVANLHGLFWLVLNLVERGPLVLVVDDAQWSDEPSLRFLHRLAQRVDELPLVVLLTMRPDGDSPASPAGDLLRALRGATHVAPEPLTERAVGRLVETTAGRAVDDRLRHACWLVTRGNPFFVTELAAELANVASGADAADEIASFLPERIGQFIRARLAAAEASTCRLAEAVAILGESATLRRAAQLAGIDSAAGEAAARWLVGAWIFDDNPLPAFRHPIVRSGVDASIPGPVRASLHRRAALLLADEAVEIGIVGAQLRTAEATADPRVVQLLRAAADDAGARGEPEVAVALLRRALMEPPGTEERAEVIVELARAEATAGAPEAPETFTQALALIDDPGRRADLHADLGHAFVAAGQWAEARDAFERGMTEALGLDEARQARLEAGFLEAAWITMEDRAAIGERVQRILTASELGPAHRELAAWIAFQQGAAVSSTAHEMGDLVKRVVSEAPIEVLVREGQLVEVAAGLLLETDDLPLEVEFLTRALATARGTGPLGKAGVYAYCRSWPNYYMGRLTDAIADSEEARRAAELGWEAFLPAAAAVAAQAYIEREELDLAEAAIALDPERWGQRLDGAMLLPLAAGRLALARGDAAAAAEHLRRVADSAGAQVMRNSVPTDWRGWLASALVLLDRRDEARQIACETVEIARAWGAAWPLGNALRVAALAEGGTAGLALLREAEELLRGNPARLEEARLLVDLGAALRRFGSLTDARDVLSRAADLSRQIGARALLARATTELRAAGARPRRIALSGVESLTPAELRVAQEALAGRTNREIAQALFVTPKAVEFHLANTYRKLGIGSRSELAGAVRGRLS